jgi:hypothetical protein
MEVGLRKFLTVLGLLAAASAHASVTLTIASPVSSPPIGAYIRADINNCLNPTIVNSNTTIPQSQNYYLNGQSSITVTMPDNVTQIACNGNLLSYYTFTYVSGSTQTQIKSVELPPGTFALGNLANLTAPPYNPGVIQGPVGPQGPSGALNIRGQWSSTTTYAIGDGVTYNTVLYASLIASNVGNTPSSSPTQWQAISVVAPAVGAGRTVYDVAGFSNLADWTIASGTAPTPNSLNQLPLASTSGSLPGTELMLSPGGIAVPAPDENVTADGNFVLSSTSDMPYVGQQSIHSTAKFGWFAVFNASANTLTLWQQDGTVPTYISMPPLTLPIVAAVGDRIHIALTRNVNTYRATIDDWTQSYHDFVTYTVPLTGNNGKNVNNTASWAVGSIGGSPALQSFSVYSLQPQNADVAVLTDSKGIYYGDSPEDRWPAKIGALGNIAMWSGPSDGVAESAASLPYIIKSAPKAVIYAMGRNNWCGGVAPSSTSAWQAQYTSNVNTLLAAGIKVVLELPLPELSCDQTAPRAFILSTATTLGLFTLDPSTNFSTSTMLAPDGVHENKTGHAVYATNDVAQWPYTSPTNPVQQRPALAGTLYPDFPNSNIPLRFNIPGNLAFIPGSVFIRGNNANVGLQNTNQAGVSQFYVNSSSGVTMGAVGTGNSSYTTYPQLDGVMYMYGSGVPVCISSYLSSGGTPLPCGFKMAATDTQDITLSGSLTLTVGSIGAAAGSVAAGSLYGGEAFFGSTGQSVYDTSGYFYGQATAPSGSCTTTGAWVFSKDGHATWCNGTTWVSKI